MLAKQPTLKFTQLSALIALMSLFGSNTALANSAAEFSLLGMNPLNLSQTDIRKQLAQWQGLDTASHVIDNERYDRFYPVHILRETYRIDFRYELNGQFASLQIRYRPQHSEYHNQTAGTDINAVRQQLESSIGLPSYRTRRVTALSSYDAYHWEDEQASILLDYEAQLPGRPVVLHLRKKDTSLAGQYRPWWKELSP